MKIFKHEMSFLAKKVLENLKKHDLLDQYEQVIISVSGGADSIALLLLIYEIYQGHFEQISVLHFDHKLRKNSNTDSQFIKEICQSMNLNFYLRTADNIFQKTTNIQNTARIWRKKVSEELAHQKSSKIVLAHHLDDQNETILLKLLRGTHLSHLQGMQWKTLPYIRPLLNIRKSDLIQYLKERNQIWVEDESNQSSKYLRNRIRNELLPLMNTLAKGALNQRLKSLHQQSLQLQQYLDQFVQEQPLSNAYGLLNLQNWQQIPALKQEAILHHEFGKYDLMLNSKQITKFRKACQDLNLKVKEEVAKSYFFCKQGQFAWIEAPHLTKKMTLNKIVCYNEIADIWKMDLSYDDHSKPSFFLFVKNDSTLRLRFRKNGDSFYSKEKNKLMKLNQFLYDQKIPLAQRNHLPCLCLDEKLIAVFPYFMNQYHSSKYQIKIWVTLSLIK